MQTYQDAKIIRKKLLLIVLFFQSGVYGWSTVYFTPRDDLRTHLIELIDQERKSIDCAVYMLTEKTIAQALVQAYVRGVKVRIIVDQISMGEKYGKGLYLKNNGLEVAVFVAAPLNAYIQPIMHHKFFIFGHNAQMQKPLLWTGSYNCTASASRLHAENVMLSDEPHVISQYQECFLELLNRIRSGT